MRTYFKTILVLLLMMAPAAMAQVDLPQDNASYKARLNDELRSTVRRLNDIEGVDYATQTELDAEMNTSTGHDHDGTDSKKVLVTDLDFTGGSSTTYVRGDGTFNSPPSLSNVLFSFTGQKNNGTAAGFYVGADATPANGIGDGYSYWYVDGTAYEEVIECKWKKIPGVSTVTVYAFLKNGAGGSYLSYCKVDIGGQNGEGSTSESAGDWVTFTVDVSGLTDGTVYEVSVQLKSEDADYPTGLYSLVGFGS